MFSTQFHLSGCCIESVFQWLIVWFCVYYIALAIQGGSAHTEYVEFEYEGFHTSLADDIDLC